MAKSNTQTFDDKNSNYLQCSVINCFETKTKNSSIELYSLPHVSLNMPIPYQIIEKKQRCAWLQSIIFKNDKHSYHVCGKHFHTGKLFH